MKEFLEELKVSVAQNLATRLLWSVWQALDWKSPLWKSAGPQVYDRFESRVVQATRVAVLGDFPAKLGRRCGVAVPRPTAEDVLDLGTISGPEVLRELRANPSLLVAYLRLWNEARKPSHVAKNQDQPSLFGGAE